MMGGTKERSNLEYDCDIIIMIYCMHYNKIIRYDIQYYTILIYIGNMM